MLGRLFRLTLLVGLMGLETPSFLRASGAADGPPYAVKLRSDSSMSVVHTPSASDTLSFDLLSDTARKVLVQPAGRKVVASGCDTGVRITTANPGSAVQSILHQISDQTGLRLHYAVDSRIAAIKPVVMLQGFSDTATVTILLTPDGGDTFTVTCVYVIDARPPGSLDGTRAGAEQLRAEVREIARRMNDDSIAAALPATISDADARRDDFVRQFFRGGAKISVERNGRYVEALVLMTKRQNTYAVGFYEQQDGDWLLLDRPIVLSQTNAPYFSNLPQQNRNALRADKLDGHGSAYVVIENGHVVRRDL